MQSTSSSLVDRVLNKLAQPGVPAAPPQPMDPVQANIEQERARAEMELQSQQQQFEQQQAADQQEFDQQQTRSQQQFDQQQTTQQQDSTLQQQVDQQGLSMQGEQQQQDGAMQQQQMQEQQMMQQQQEQEAAMQEQEAAMQQEQQMQQQMQMQQQQQQQQAQTAQDAQQQQQMRENALMGQQQPEMGKQGSYKVAGEDAFVQYYMQRNPPGTRQDGSSLAAEYDQRLRKEYRSIAASRAGSEQAPQTQKTAQYLAYEVLYKVACEEGDKDMEKTASLGLARLAVGGMKLLGGAAKGMARGIGGAAKGMARGVGRGAGGVARGIGASRAIGVGRGAGATSRLSKGMGAVNNASMASSFMPSGGSQPMQQPNIAKPNPGMMSKRPGMQGGWQRQTLTAGVQRPGQWGR